MRIMIAFPGHAMSTKDVAVGYTHALTHLGHEISTFDYHDRLSFYDVALQAWEARNPDFHWEKEHARIFASEHLATEAVDFRPDVVLAVCGLSLHRRAYELLYKLGLPVVTLLTESPYLDETQADMLKVTKAAGAFTNDRVSVSAIANTAGIPVAYLPHSFDPSTHYPRAAAPDQQSEVFFFGTLWPERKVLFAKLLDRPGFNIGGTEIDLPEGSPIRIMDNAELAGRYCGTKVALNHHRTFSGIGEDGHQQHVKAAYSLGPRAFEIAACGAFQLCDDTRPELDQVFRGSVATYADGVELEAMVDYYRARPGLRQEMAAEALRLVQPCSFVERARSVVVPFLEQIVR